MILLTEIKVCNNVDCPVGKSNRNYYKITAVQSTTGCPKKCTNRTESQPEMSVMGVNFTIDMTWVRLIQLSLSKKNQSLEALGASKW